MISSSELPLARERDAFQVDGALVHATSGNELSRVRTEFRLHPPYQAMPTRSREPTLLCKSSSSQAFLFLHLKPCRSSTMARAVAPAER